MAQFDAFIFPSNAQCISIELIAPWEIWIRFFKVIFELVSVIGGWGICYEIVPGDISLVSADGKSTLV